MAVTRSEMSLVRRYKAKRISRALALTVVAILVLIAFQVRGITSPPSLSELPSSVVASVPTVPTTTGQAWRHYPEEIPGECWRVAIYVGGPIADKASYILAPCTLLFELFAQVQTASYGLEGSRA